MTFSAEWENFHATEDQIMGSFPQLQMMFAMFVQEPGKVLEVGTGLGMNISFLVDVCNADYYGIEGSQSAVDLLIEMRPEMKGKVVCGDFTKAIPFEHKFDVIVDRAAIAHNDRASIERAIGLIYDALKPGGLFISSDWFSENHSELKRGTKVDEYTRIDYQDGQFKGVGKVHFSTEEELRVLLSAFDRHTLIERTSRRVAPGGFLDSVVDVPLIAWHYASADYTSAIWDFVVRKPK